MLIVILANLGGMVVVLVLGMLFFYVLISRRLTLQLRRTVEDMEQLLTDRIQTEFSLRNAGDSLMDAATLRGLLGSGRQRTRPSSNVPPMRIHVRSVIHTYMRCRFFANQALIHSRHLDCVCGE